MNALEPCGRFGPALGRLPGAVAHALPESMLTAISNLTIGCFVSGTERFQRQVALMVGRRSWPGKCGRLKRREPGADQRDLPT